MKLKIAIFNNDIPGTVGGASRFENQITNGIANIKSSHKFFTTSKSDQAVHPLLEHLQLYKQPVLPKWADRLRRLRRKPLLPVPTATETLRKSSVDLLYSPTPWIPKVDIPTIVTVWDLQHRINPYFPEVSTLGWTWPDREKHYSDTLPRALGIVVGTERGKQEVINFYGIHEERIHVIPFVVDSKLVDCESVRPMWAPPGPFIFYPAQFWPHKNHVTLVLATSILSKRGFSVHCVCPGSPATSQAGTQEHITRIAKSENIDHRLHLPGHITDQELKWCYENAICLAYPSIFGPDNLPPIEAFRLGCPVVASDIPGAAEQQDDGSLRFPPTNETALADKVIELILNTETKKRLITRGYEISQKLTTATYTIKLLELFDNASLLLRCWARK
jgi:glycosyltransferase involved in cell wall biosynthesis